jgi:SNF2 family DNA or RNA helicase
MMSEINKQSNRSIGHMYVLSIHDKKLYLVNKKYPTKNSASKIINSEEKNYFYEYPDLVTLNVFSLINAVRDKTKKLSDIYSEIRKFTDDIPIWVLEYQEIWDMIKDNIYLVSMTGMVPKQKATPEKIKTTTGIKVGSQKVNIDGQIKYIKMYLGDNASNVISNIKDKKDLSIKGIFYTYNGSDVINSFYGNGLLQKDSQVIIPKWNKIVRPDKETLKDIEKYVDEHQRWKFSINEPNTITFENLIKFSKKFKDKATIYYGMSGQNIIKFLDVNSLISSFNYSAISLNYIKKIIDAYYAGETIINNNNDLIILDLKEIESYLDKLLDLFFSKDFKDFVSNFQKAENYKKEDSTFLKELKENKDFIADLYPHQKVGASWIYNSYKNKISGLLLADDMGLGKTLQTIAFLSSFKTKKNILIIATATLVGNWESEITKFNSKLFKKHNIKIISYERLLRDGIGKTDILILDEAQKIKNNKTAMFKKIDSIKKEFALIITGTPIENSLDDIINILAVIDGIFQKLKVLKKFHGGNTNEGDFAIKLRKLISPIYLQRKKSEVGNINLDSELIQKPIFIKPDDKDIQLMNAIKKIYKDQLLKLNAKNNYEFYEANIILTGLLRMRQAISYPAQLPDDLLNLLPKDLQVHARSSTPKKYTEMKNEIKRIVSKKEKVVIFTQFNGTFDYIKEKLKKDGFKVTGFSGSDSSPKRKIIVDSFQEGLFDVIIISLKAGNAGITLHTANHVFIYDLWFNPQVLAQAIARVHRIGQNKDVFANFLILDKTFDKTIYDIIYDKKKLINNFESGLDTKKTEKAVGEDIFKKEVFNTARNFMKS